MRKTVTPDCLECGGACCEEMLIEVGSRTDPVLGLEWLRARGAGPVVRGHVAIRCRCPELTVDGKCALHDVGKPVLCQTYRAGSQDCVDAIRRRRPWAAGFLLRNWDPEQNEHAL